jgi:hypothetical protein
MVHLKRLRQCDDESDNWPSYARCEHELHAAGCPAGETETNVWTLQTERSGYRVVGEMVRQTRCYIHREFVI